MTPSSTPTAVVTPTETAVPHPTPTATPPGHPERQGGHSAPACARFNLDMGRNGRTGATVPGRYEMIEVGTGRLLAQWEAQANWTCSPWLDNIRLTFKEGSWVEVFFYPEGETAPVKLEILNPAPGTTYGWLAPGMCHAIELQFPASWSE
ncbi:MAG TPA: hypothetical protein ENJ93_08590 [Chloroflexi bacterium]|nr:hypothetical protein [Chloroflexota bacterium]